MPQDTPRQAKDYLNNWFSEGMRVTPAAKLELGIPNLVPDPSFGDIQADGAPRGADWVHGPQDEGYHFYASTMDGEQATISRQTFHPEPPEDDSFDYTRPIFGGAARPQPNALVARLALKLEKGTVQKKKVTRVGFAPGVYWYAVSIVGAGGSHTMTTTPVEFELSDAEMHFIKAPLLTEMSEGGEKFGLWLSEVNKGPQTLRLQEVVTKRGSTHIMYGPWKAGRTEPTRNETEVGYPKRAEWGQPRRRDIWRGNAHHDLQTPMRVRISIAEVTRRGTSFASPVSEDRRFKGRDRKVRVRNNDGSTKDDEDSNEPNKKETKTVHEHIKNEAVYIRPNKVHPETIGYQVYALVDDIPDPPWYRIKRTERTNAARHHRLEEIAQLYGYRSDDAGVATEEGGGKDDSPRRYQYSLVAEDPPTEDTSGIANPTGETDLPTQFGPGRPAAGQYWLTYTRIINGLQTLAAPPVRVSIAADEVMVLQVPARVNKIQNARFRKVDLDLQPSSWTLDKTDSTFNMDQPGVLTMDTTGPISNNDLNVENPSAIHDERIDINTNRTETLRGVLACTLATSGTVKYGLVQYTQDGAFVNSTMAASTLVLATLSTVSEIEFIKRIGPASDNPDFQWHEDASYAKPRVWTDGNGRNMKWSISDLAWHPFDGAPRKVELAEVGSLLPSVASTDKALPFASGHINAIMLPPITFGGGGGGNNTPVDVIDFNGTHGFTMFRSVANANTQAEVITPAGGNSYLQVKNDQTTVNFQGYGHKSYAATDWSPTGAARVTRITLAKTPTYTGAKIGLMSLLSNSGGVVARVYLHKVTKTTSDMYFAVYDAKGVAKTPRKIGTALKDTHYVDLEMIGGYGGGEDSVSMVVGVNGSIPRPVQGIVAGDLHGTRLGTLRLGCDYNTDKRAKFTFQYDNVRITKRGDVPVSAGSPALTAIPQADWPRRAGTVLQSANGALSHTASAGQNSVALQHTYTVQATTATPSRRAAVLAATGDVLAELWETATGTLVVRGLRLTEKQVAVAPALNSAVRTELLVRGIGTKSGSVNTYVWKGTERLLLDVQVDLDFSTFSLASAASVGRTNLTVTFTSVTRRGSFEDIDVNADNTPIYQGYTFINPLDVSEDDIGLTIEEGFCLPEVEHTWAIRLAWTYAEEGCQPFNVVLYDENGDSYVAARLTGATGTNAGSSDWADRAVFFTPRPGFYRYKVLNRNMKGGIFRYQQPFMARGTYLTEADRDIARAGKRKVRESARVTLRGKIPDLATGVYQQDYQEDWIRLLAYGETPEGTPQPFSAADATDTFTAVGHGYADGGTVKFIQPTVGLLPSGVTKDVTYYIKNATTDTFRVASTFGGTAITLASSGTGEVYGVTAIEAEYRSTNQTPPAAWECPWTADPADIPQDRTWADVFVTLSGDGNITPTIEPGQIELVYKTWQPTLLRQNRSPYPGGTVVTSLVRDYETADLDTEPVGGYPRRRRVTDPIRRLEGELLVDFFTPEALVQFLEEHNSGEQFVIEHPAANSFYLIDPYDIGEVDYEESELLEETIGWLKASVTISGARILEKAPLIPLDEFGSELTP